VIICLRDQLPLIGGVGGIESRRQRRAAIVAAGNMQPKIALRFSGMLPAILLPAAILGQVFGTNADLLGNEGNHRLRQNLVVKPSSTGMSHQSQLESETKAVLRRPLRHHEIEVSRIQRAVPDQLPLVLRRREQRVLAISLHQGTTRHDRSLFSDGRSTIAEIRTTALDHFE
jgi:hypothetical protein